MRILIEEHQYQAEQIRDVLHGIDAMQDIDGNVSINYVGYYYNTQLSDCVFILPKVLLEDTPEGRKSIRQIRPGNYRQPEPEQPTLSTGERLHL